MKPQRWYERIDGLVYVYNQPYPEKAQFVSIVHESDLKFYRNNFNLNKIWKNEDFSNQ